MDDIRNERGEGVYGIGTRGWTGIAQAATVKADQEVDRLNGPVDRARGALDNLVQDYRYHVERVAELDARLSEATRERDEASVRASQWDLDRHTEKKRADRLQYEVNAVRADMERNLAKLLATREELDELRAKLFKVSERVWSPEVEDALGRPMTASAATLRGAITDVRRLLDAPPSSPES